MGRSRGGLTTKIHALVDTAGLPVKLKLTAGQAHDGRSAADMLSGIGSGQALLADAAYDSDALRRQMKAQGGWLCAKPVSYRRQKPPFSRWLYRFRNVVERFFNRIKHCRAIATRYEKHDDNYLAPLRFNPALVATTDERTQGPSAHDEGRKIKLGQGDSRTWDTIPPTFSNRPPFRDDDVDYVRALRQKD